MKDKVVIYTYGPVPVRFQRVCDPAPGSEAKDKRAGVALAKFMYRLVPQGVLDGFLETIIKLEESE